MTGLGATWVTVNKEEMREFLQNLQKTQFYSNFLSESLVFFMSIRTNKQFPQKTSNLLIHSFVIAHSLSFGMRDLSDWLTVAHFVLSESLTVLCHLS